MEIVQGEAVSEHYLASIGYDNVMCIQDHEHNSRRESNLLKFMFLASCGFAALFSGIGIQVAMAGRRYRSSLKTKPPIEGRIVYEDPVLFASRALAWGTLYSILGTGTIGLVTVGIWKL